jgi:ketosteroid isomerase-like protein
MRGREVPHSDREALQVLYEVLRTGDVDALDGILAEDCVTDYPQSGERLVGRENLKAMIANYPGGTLQMSDKPTTIIGDEERYMLTPTFNVVKVQGGGDTLVATTRSRYPDGSVWYVMSIVHFHDGMIVRTQQFFAPIFDPPEWRSRWVEIVPEEERLG